MSLPKGRTRASLHESWEEKAAAAAAAARPPVFRVVLTAQFLGLFFLKAVRGRSPRSSQRRRGEGQPNAYASKKKGEEEQGLCVVDS